MRRLLAILGACLMIAGTDLLAAPDPVGDCPAGLVCFTPQEAHRINRRLIELERDVKILRAKRPRILWATVGAEYLPNDGHTQPYALGGARLGPLTVWGGFFGETPAAGIGWTF